MIKVHNHREFILLIILNCALALGKQGESLVYVVDHHIQTKLIGQARQKCSQKINNVTEELRNRMKIENYCPPVWDGILCWELHYPPNKPITQPCPNYIDKFFKKGVASRFCTEDGTWLKTVKNNISKDRTDFSSCFADIESKSNVFLVIASMSCIGFVISVISVIIAILILRIKRLHCDRNTIHINLFVACMFRSLSSLLAYITKSNETNSWCKVHMTIHNYFIQANFTWVFVEALYLHNVLTIHTFQETRILIYLYIILGWGLPFIAISIWVTLRLLLDDTYCWDSGTHPYRPDVIVLTIYPTLLLIQNIIFFIKLIVILHQKMTNVNLTPNQNVYVKMGRSILVLIVVFGLYHLVFIPLDFIGSKKTNNSTYSFKFYIEYLLNSVQGFLLSMMFCFCNSEVHRELKRKFFNRHNCNIRNSETEKQPRKSSCQRKKMKNQSIRQESKDYGNSVEITC